VYVDRCPLADDICRTEVPPVVPLTSGHWTRCHHSESIDQIKPPDAGNSDFNIGTETIVQLAAVSKTFRQRGSDVPALVSIDLGFKEGETLGLVGESGSGKSTTGYCVLQVLRPTSGSVVFDGEELTELSGKELRRMRRRMQLVFQDPHSSLDPRMTVGDIVGEPLAIHKVGSRSERRNRVRELLHTVGFDPTFTNRYPHEFSGGQRQRIGIARALALSPDLLVLDEPVSALDVSIQAQILNLLKDLQREFGLTYLFIAHDLAVVRTMSDRIAVMNQGKIIEIGLAEEVYTSPRELYTKELLAAVPVPDPRAMKERKRERQRLREALAA
jgi:ABC-type oligopeptide transport system ATPase subunit